MEMFFLQSNCSEIILLRKKLLYDLRKRKKVILLLIILSEVGTNYIIPKAQRNKPQRSFQPAKAQRKMQI